MGEFGDKFRKAREKKDISLDDVSNVTKISSRMLRAIEEEHFDELPGGVFNKGFIRAYAKHLGLNDEEAVTDYLACLRQAQIDAHEVWEPEASAHASATPRLAAPEMRRRMVEANQVAPKKFAPKSPVPIQIEELPDLQLPRAENVRPSQKDFALKPDREVPWSILAIASVVVILAVVLWIRRSHSTATVVSPSAAKTEPSSASASAATVPVGMPAPVDKSFTPLPATSATTVPHPSALSTHPQKGPVSSAPGPRSALPANSTAPAASPAGRDQAQEEESDVSTRTIPPVPAVAPAKSGNPLKLVIRAQETSWISVQADGQTVSQETLIAPAHASIHATREIIARIGNAAGVTFLWNGKEIPADGAEAEVKTFVFDADGMRVVSSNPQPAQDH